MSGRGLSDLIARGEGSTVEFKRSARSDLGREICAFANADGGAILLGVDDDGAIRGVGSHNRLKSQVQSVARSADPSISVEMESMGDVLAVTVPPQRARPYSFRGQFFIRDGATSQQMSRDELREFFFAVGAIRYDECPCHRFSLDDDLDDGRWTAFRRRAKIPDHMGPRDALTNLELLTADGGMTNAGAWLLAKDIRRFHLSAHLTCALFFGTTKTEIINRSDLDEDLCSIIDGAVEWVRSKINVHYIITGERVNREERPELPLDAVREAVVNAVAHRDYRSTANIQVCLYHDRLEVVSPGGLPPGMTEAELGTKSVPRNRLLFGVLHRTDKVEHIGTGIRRIRDLCRKWGVPAPVIDVSENWVTVTFRRIPIGSQGLDTALRGGQLGTRLAPSRHQVAILRKSLVPHPITELMEAVGRKDPTTFRNQILGPLLEAEWMEMTIPHEPASTMQRYRTTMLGQHMLAAVDAFVAAAGHYPLAGNHDHGRLRMVREPRKEWSDE